jgi:hypothetical protein
VKSEREVIARAIHEDYVRRRRTEGDSSEDKASLAPWESLPETLRESNRHQADDIYRKLSAISCEAAREGSADDPVSEFNRQEVEKLARLEHDRWVRERRASGWKFGPSKDVIAQFSPYLVPWEDLSEAVRDLDRDTVRRIPHFLATLGFVVVRLTQSSSTS